MLFSALFAGLLSAAAVQAATFTVVVGGNTTLTYSPTSLSNVAVGDTIQFQFQSKNHTVTQSTFADPCTLMTTPTMGIDSGFAPVAAGATSFPQFSFTMTNASAPLWFYCKQTGHCAAGMVFAVNPTATKTFAQFQAAAMASNSTGTGTGTGSSASASGFSTKSASGSTTSATSATSSTSGALRLAGGSAAGLLTAVGLVAGLVL